MVAIYTLYINGSSLLAVSTLFHFLQVVSGGIKGSRECREEVDIRQSSIAKGIALTHILSHSLSLLHI